MKINILGILLLTVSLVACGGGGGSGGAASECAPLNARIFGGDTCDQTKDTPVVAVVPVLQSGEKYLVAGICTGALVTVDDFVTSAHCFLDPLRKFGALVVGFAVVVGGNDGDLFAVSNLAVHPGYNFRVGSPFDVAMGTLHRVAEPPIGPLPLAASEPTMVNDEVYAFGYGTNEQGKIGDLKAARLNIDGVVEGNLVATLATSTASICSGDSGGPLVKVIGGVASLAGVNSFGLQSGCQGAASPFSGFVDVQFPTVEEFIVGYAPDVALQ